MNMRLTESMALCALMWCVYAVDLILPIDFTAFGIAPRDLAGLPATLYAPLLHANLFHLLANSIPFVILGALLQMHGLKVFWQTTLIVALLSGLGVWLFSSAGRVVGASGLVFGYWSYLLASAYLKRSILAISLGIVVFLLYGFMLFGLLDLRQHISWAAHFFGLIGGVVAALYHANIKTVRSE